MSLQPEIDGPAGKFTGIHRVRPFEEIPVADQSVAYKGTPTQLLGDMFHQSLRLALAAADVTLPVEFALVGDSAGGITGRPVLHYEGIELPDSLTTYYESAIKRMGNMPAYTTPEAFANAAFRSAIDAISSTRGLTDIAVMTAVLTHTFKGKYFQDGTNGGLKAVTLVSVAEVNKLTDAMVRSWAAANQTDAQAESDIPAALAAYADSVNFERPKGASPNIPSLEDMTSTLRLPKQEILRITCSAIASFFIIDLTESASKAFSQDSYKGLFTMMRVKNSSYKVAGEALERIDVQDILSLPRRMDNLNDLTRVQAPFTNIKTNYEREAGNNDLIAVANIFKLVMSPASGYDTVTFRSALIETGLAKKGFSCGAATDVLSDALSLGVTELIPRLLYKRDIKTHPAFASMTSADVFLAYETVARSIIQASRTRAAVNFDDLTKSVSELVTRQMITSMDQRAKDNTMLLGSTLRSTVPMSSTMAALLITTIFKVVLTSRCFLKFNSRHQTTLTADWQNRFKTEAALQEYVQIAEQVSLSYEAFATTFKIIESLAEEALQHDFPIIPAPNLQLLKDEMANLQKAIKDMGAAPDAMSVTYFCHPSTISSAGQLITDIETQLCGITSTHAVEDVRLVLSTAVESPASSIVTVVDGNNNVKGAIEVYTFMSPGFDVPQAASVMSDHPESYYPTALSYHTVRPLVPSEMKILRVGNLSALQALNPVGRLYQVYPLEPLMRDLEKVGLSLLHITSYGTIVPTNDLMRTIFSSGSGSLAAAQGIAEVYRALQDGYLETASKYQAVFVVNEPGTYIELREAPAFYEVIRLSIDDYFNYNYLKPFVHPWPSMFSFERDVRAFIPQTSIHEMLSRTASRKPEARRLQSSTTVPSHLYHKNGQLRKRADEINGVDDEQTPPPATPGTGQGSEPDEFAPDTPLNNSKGSGSNPKAGNKTGPGGKTGNSGGSKGRNGADGKGNNSGSGVSGQSGSNRKGGNSHNNGGGTGGKGSNSGGKNGGSGNGNNNRR